MSEPMHIVGLDTYGVEKVFVSSSKEKVSALKCTRAVPAILRLLFGEAAVDVTPVRASYSYIQLKVHYRLKKSYLLLKLTDEELAQVEAITRQQPIGSWVYLWRDGNWAEFPCGSHSEYRLASATSSLSYPRFSGASVPAIIPSMAEGSATADNKPSGGITVERSGDWWWITGDTYPHKEMIWAAGARWSKKRHAWYFIGDHLPEAIQNLAPTENAPAVPANVEPTPATSKPLSDNAAAAPSDEANRVTPTQVEETPPMTPEPVIEIAPNNVIGSTRTVGRHITIPQSFIGRVNVVGDCYCFGVVVDRRPPTYKNIPIYISVVGPATSVEALWAKLAQGKETAVVPEDRSQTAIYLEPNKGGLYTRYQKKLDELGVDHLILVHEDMVEPEYPSAGNEKETATTYMLAASEEQRLAKLGEHVRKTVKIAVFERWFEYLYRDGLKRGLVRDCAGYGVQATAIKLDPTRWTEVITEGLSKKLIHFP